jgi:hypothetical protein
MTLLFALLSLPAFATAQVANLLEIEGSSRALRSNPLGGSRLRVDPAATCGWHTSTACWAGYTSNWALDQGQLWFTGLRECHNSRSVNAGRALVDIPDETDRLPATWYTGTLSLPSGELIHYVHGGWESLFSQERRIQIEAGRVVSDEVHVLVAAGYSLIDTLLFPPILVPRDLATPPGELITEGDCVWERHASADPTRALRLLLPPAKGWGPSDPPPADPDEVLNAHLRQPASATRQRADLGPRGRIAWEDHLSPDGASIVRTIAWIEMQPSRFPEAPFRVLELWTAPDDTAGRETFTQQFAGPRP